MLNAMNTIDHLLIFYFFAELGNELIMTDPKLEKGMGVPRTDANVGTRSTWFNSTLCCFILYQRNHRITNIAASISLMLSPP